MLFLFFPEEHTCIWYNEKCCFGIILNELLIGKYPYIETEFGPAKVTTSICL